MLHPQTLLTTASACICKPLRRPGIFKDSIPPAAELQAGTTKRVVVPARQAGNQFLSSLKGSQIWAQGPL
jgi:hypothetical protein